MMAMLRFKNPVNSPRDMVVYPMIYRVFTCLKRVLCGFLFTINGPYVSGLGFGELANSKLEKTHESNRPKPPHGIQWPTRITPLGRWISFWGNFLPIFGTFCCSGSVNHIPRGYLWTEPLLCLMWLGEKDSSPFGISSNILSYDVKKGLCRLVLNHLKNSVSLSCSTNPQKTTSKNAF